MQRDTERMLRWYLRLRLAKPTFSFMFLVTITGLLLFSLLCGRLNQRLHPRSQPTVQRSSHE